MPSVNPDSFVLGRARAQIKEKHGYEKLRDKKQHIYIKSTMKYLVYSLV